MNSPSRHIHLSGICGTAMASLAGLLQLQGHRITGSDKAAYPPMSDLLRELGIPILEPYAERISTPRPISLSSAMPSHAAILKSSAYSTSDSLHLHGRAPSRRVPHRPRIPGHRGHSRQNHHHQHAGVDLPGRRARKSASSPHSSSVALRRTSAPAFNCVPRARSSLKATNTTWPSSTRAEVPALLPRRAHPYPCGIRPCRYLRRSRSGEDRISSAWSTLSRAAVHIVAYDAKSATYR